MSAPRPSPVPRVVTLTGPESTGKTTLAQGLAERFGGTLSLEGARVYLDARLAADAGATLTAADVAPIARAQLALEAAAEETARDDGRALLVRDTDLVSTVVYARAAYGAVPGWVVDAARARRADLYLLCDVDVPWIADGLRGNARARAALHAAFVATLAELDCRWLAIRGDWATRTRRAEQAVAALLDPTVGRVRDADAP